MTTNKEQADVEKYFKSLGYTLHEIKDSVFREEKSTFVFQTDNKNHTVDGSTILYDHAVKIHRAVAEDRARMHRLVNLYGTPNCDYLHHIKKQQHESGETCPVVTEISKLISSLDNETL